MWCQAVEVQYRRWVRRNGVSRTSRTRRLWELVAKPRGPSQAADPARVAGWGRQELYRPPRRLDNPPDKRLQEDPQELPGRVVATDVDAVGGAVACPYSPTDRAVGPEETWTNRLVTDTGCHLARPERTMRSRHREA